MAWLIFVVGLLIGSGITFVLVALLSANKMDDLPDNVVEFKGKESRNEPRRKIKSKAAKTERKSR